MEFKFSVYGLVLFLLPMLINLAVFPVMYFIFASIWMNNYIALAIMILFGIVHFKISYENLYINKNNLE